MNTVFLLKNDKLRNSSDVKIILFADNTTMFASGICLNILVTLTNKSSRMVKLRFEKNCLTSCEDETQFVVFRRKKRAFTAVNKVYSGDSVV